MSLLITEKCIVCDLCLTVCPNDAISAGEEIFLIDPELCTECVGRHPVSQCVKVCPVKAIVPDPQHVESREELQRKCDVLKQRSAA